jgi:hypothetical protein
MQSIFGGNQGSFRRCQTKEFSRIIKRPKLILNFTLTPTRFPYWYSLSQVEKVVRKFRYSHLRCKPDITESVCTTALILMKFRNVRHLIQVRTREKCQSVMWKH